MWSWWLFVLACTGEAPVGSDFTLHLEPVLASNQGDLFEDLSSLELVIQRADGSLDAPRDLGDPSSGTLVDETGFDPLEDVIVRLEGYDAQTLHAWGRTPPVSLDAGTQDTALFVGAVNEFAWLDTLETETYGAPVVSLGDGRFFTAGGLTRADGAQAEASSATAILDLLDPADGLGFRDIDAPLPVYAELGVSEEVSTGRFGYTLTALEDGRVLMVGGGRTYPIAAGSTATRSIELWEPDSGQWNTDLRMTYPRNGHITIRNTTGKVLIWGGIGTEYGGDNTMVPATAFTPNYLEYFDPSTDSVEKSEIPAEIAPGALGVAAANFQDQDGSLICGGVEYVTIDADEDGSQDDLVWRTTSRCVRVNIVGDEYLPDDAMSEPLAGHAMVTLADGRILLTGGAPQEEPMLIGRFIDDYYGDIPAVDSAWTYNPGAGDSQRWSTALPNRMNYPRAGHQMHLLPDGKVLIVGGTSLWNASLQPGGDYVKCAEIFDPNENSFTVVNGCDDESTTGLQAGAAGLSLAADPDYGVLVAGGTTGDNAWSSEVALYLIRGE